ncbi:dockerin type I domain-containing protein [Candidatus Marinimicrobia bacterium]|nr:dockerin type I domain-containing protein [Candidatus Neomarinimicrobiota bacterium]
MSDFQEELKNDYGFENIVFIAVGDDFFNTATTNNFCANSDLPLVLDIGPDYPIRAQFSPYSEHKSLTVTGYNGEFLGNVSVTSLNTTVKNQIIEIITENYQDNILGDVNFDELVNVLDVVLVVNLVLSSTFQNYADINSDGFVNVLDVVQIINIILG